ncbi:hypothetical protein J3R30DRAFT_3730045 [Lentinula aciculospora]|uniref:Transmembrane protein n=1 Tax=Lentinula aciculospora TaxID=153920 RepID=A0A9W9AQS5_9AGAR|nr:hypothetical protein J3R30DRAFT_3730045 [Lentinula aciculospora]
MIFLAVVDRKQVTIIAFYMLKYFDLGQEFPRTPSLDYCVLLSSFFTILLYGPLESTCLTFNVSSPILSQATLTVGFVRINADPMEWNVQAVGTYAPANFSFSVIAQAHNQSQLSGDVTLLRWNFDINVTLQAWSQDQTSNQNSGQNSGQNSCQNSCQNSEFKPLGNKTTSFLLPALSNPSITATSAPSSKPNGSSSSTSSSLSSSSLGSQILRGVSTTQTHKDVIIGAVMGSFAFALISAVALVILVRRSRRQRTSPSEFMRDKMVRVPDLYQGDGAQHDIAH